MLDDYSSYDEEIRVRVGEPESAIMPGDYSPSGDMYRQGQFAPSLEDLSLESLVQANEAGLLNKNLPIFEGDKVSKEKLKTWTPDVPGVYFSDKVPKYSSAVVVDAFSGLGSLLSAINMKHILTGDRATQDNLSLPGETIISSEYSYEGRKFEGRLRVYPSFYKYVAIPLIGEIPGYRTGLSVASYSVFHALGHLVLARVIFDGKLDTLGNYINIGWTKYAGDDTSPGQFMSMKNDSVWRRKGGATYPTEASRYSYEEDFAESLALFFTHQKYLAVASPERFSSIKSILEGYGYVLQG